MFELTLTGIHNMNAVNLAAESVQFPFLLFSWSSLYFSIKQWHSASQERERLLRAEAEVREARLQALRYQLNPHFLFNSLNAVSTLVLDGEASAATKMLSQIGDFLRTSLTAKPPWRRLFHRRWRLRNSTSQLRKPGWGTGCKWS